MVVTILVREAIEVCLNAGIKPIMITGDNPITAKAIGKELGCSATSVLYYISECNDYEKIKKIHIQNNQTKRFILQ